MAALGLVCVAVAVILLLVEAHLSTGGLIATLAVGAALGGVALLLAGAAGGLTAAVALAAGICVAALGGVALLTRRLRPLRQARPRSGTKAMVGRVGVMRADEAGSHVLVDGALWRAELSVLDQEDTLQDGDRVVIEHVNGLTLHVRKAEELELNR